MPIAPEENSSSTRQRERRPNQMNAAPQFPTSLGQGMSFGKGLLCPVVVGAVGSSGITPLLASKAVAVQAGANPNFCRLYGIDLIEGDIDFEPMIEGEYWIFGLDQLERKESLLQVPILSYSAPFASEYAKLGRFRGPEGTVEGRAANRDFWVSHRESAGQWLVERLDQEHNLEVLDAAAAVLRRLGAFIIPVILQSLDAHGIAPELAECLLRSLRRENLPTEASAHYAEVVRIVQRYIRHPVEEVRQAAHETAACLFPEDSLRLLEAGQKENDAELPDIKALRRIATTTGAARRKAIDQAAVAIRISGKPDDIPAVLTRAAKTLLSFDYADRFADASDLMVKVGSPALRALARRNYSQSDPEFEHALVRSLGTLGDVRAVLSFKNSPHRFVREAVVEALDDIGDDDSIRELRDISLNDQSQFIRELAAGYLS